MKNGEIAAETVWNRRAVPPLVCDLWRLCSADQRIFTKSLFGGDFPGTFLVGAFSVGIDEGDFDTERTRYHHRGELLQQERQGRRHRAPRGVI